MCILSLTYQRDLSVEVKRDIHPVSNEDVELASIIADIKTLEQQGILAIVGYGGPHLNVFPLGKLIFELMELSVIEENEINCIAAILSKEDDKE